MAWAGKTFSVPSPGEGPCVCWGSSCGINPPLALRPFLVYPNSPVWPAFFKWSKKLISLPNFGFWKRCVGEELCLHFLTTWHVSIWTTWAKVDSSLTWGLAKYPGARSDTQPGAEIPEAAPLPLLHLLGVGHKAISHPSPWFQLSTGLSSSPPLGLNYRILCKSLYLAIGESWLLNSRMTYLPMLFVIWPLWLSVILWYKEYGELTPCWSCFCSLWK